MLLQRLVILWRATGYDPVEPPHLIVREASSDDAEAFERDIGSYGADAFEQRLTEHNACYLAIEGGRILHSSWCSTTATWTDELQTYLSPPQGDAYVYESFTRSDARGRGIYPLVLRAIAAELFDRGVPRMWIGVEAGNESSLRAIMKAAFEEAFSIGFSRTGGVVTIDVGPLDPQDSLHIVGKARPSGPLGG